MTFRLANVDGRAVIVDGPDYYDVADLSSGAVGPDPMDAVAQFEQLHALAEAAVGAEPTGAVAEVSVGPPVPRPKNCFGVGLNYKAHVAESNMEPPAVPLVFTKFPSCLVGPDADVVLDSATADYEVELVVVIGREGRNIPVGEAWDYVAGVTGGQDISDRALQFAASPPHFDLAKSRDTYGPTGPQLVSVDSFDDPNDIALTCSINGELRQNGSSSDLLFDVPTLITYLSGILTLSPGDLIFTGTPSGVGAATGTFLAPGDVIESELAGIGTLTNRCR